jgi:hypothetical protein
MPDDGRFFMQMISTRAVAFLDVQSLAPGEAREALFRDGDGSFLIYLCDGEPGSAREERPSWPARGADMA